VLRIELEAPTQPLVTGGSTAVWVRFRNVSTAPVTFQLNGTCAELFGVSILRADGGRADIENEVGGLGLCGTDPGIRVELTPGGVLSKKLDVSARASRWAEVTPGEQDSPLELAPGSPIAPGAYTLDVTVPVYTDRREGQVHLKSALNIVAK
jgi:hypothetical protein